MNNIRHLAARQLADYDATPPGQMFAEDVRISVEEAYQIQTTVAELRCIRH